MNSIRTAQKHTRARRRRRQSRIRRRITGTAERPRMAVFRSHKHFYCQLIDDIKGVTLAAASTQDPTLRDALKTGGDIGAATKVGERIAAVAKEKGLTRTVMDRRYFRYHGRVRAFAEAARKAGLQF